MNYTCPHCGVDYDVDDLREVEKGKACYILSLHGMTLRGIGRLFNLDPTAVKYHINKYKDLNNL